MYTGEIIGIYHGMDTKIIYYIPDYYFMDVPDFTWTNMGPTYYNKRMKALMPSIIFWDWRWA